MRPKVVLNSREVRLYVTAIVGVSILLLIGSSSAFAQASAEPLTLQSTTNVGDQNKQLADQINQLQQEIVRLQADIDLTGAGKKTSLKSEMKISPAPKKGMGMMAGDKSKMGMPPAKAPMRSDSTAIGMKDDQGEMAGMSPAVNSSMSPTSPAPATTGGMSGSPPETAAAGGMGVMGEIMTAPRKEIYPSLMALPDEASPEMRAGIEQVAIERMKEGTARISSGLGKLSGSTVNEDYAGMQQAAAQMREGLAEFEVGIAARRMLAEGKAPRNLALDWFKREMNLGSPTAPGEPRTPFGVTPFHLFTMALLIAFAIAMVAIYFFKMRHATALFGRVEADAKTPPNASRPLTGVPGSSTSTEKASPDAKNLPSSSAPTDGKTPAQNPFPKNSFAIPIPFGDAAKTADRADELWQARGRPLGSPKIDWLQAEKELANEASKPVTPPAEENPAAPASALVIGVAGS